jgi:P27 family predicted phage terminase small subunit
MPGKSTGRKPIPKSLKILKGTFQKCRDAKKPLTPTGKAIDPKWIAKRAKHYWKFYEPMMTKLGLLTDADQPAFSAFVDSIARLEAANKILDDEGILLQTEKGPVKHPAFSVAKDCWANIKTFSVEFGLTPSSRQRISIPKPEAPNEFQEFLKNG